MNDYNQDLDQTDEEILKDEVSDEAVEAASVAPAGLPALMHNTYCFACPATIRSKILLRKGDFPPAVRCGARPEGMDWPAP
jgi:hypothetical protein